MSALKDDCIFVILPEVHNPESGYCLMAIWPRLQGIYATNVFCGHDFEMAVDYANWINQKNGHSPAVASAVLETVMGADKIRFFDT